MNFNLIGREGAQRLAESDNCRMLKHLELESNELADEGIQHIAMSPHMVQLEHLNVKQNQIKDSGAHVISIGSLRKINYMNIN
jgi:hypothetical protein